MDREVCFVGTQPRARRSTSRTAGFSGRATGRTQQDRRDGSGRAGDRQRRLGRQPRDGDPRLSYALFDGNTVLFRRLEYDVEAARRRSAPSPSSPNSWPSASRSDAESLDKRLPLALAICLLIVVGGRSCSRPEAPPPKPVDPVAASAAPSATGASRTGRGGNCSRGAGRGTGDRRRGRADLALVFGSAASAGTTARASSRTGRRARLAALGRMVRPGRALGAGKLDPEHWTELLGPVDVPGDGRRRWSSRPRFERAPGAGAARQGALGPARDRGRREARGGRVHARSGTGVTFKKRFLFTPGADVFRFEFEIRNEAHAEAARASSSSCPRRASRSRRGTASTPSPR
jgi:hypothetical protein